MLVGVVCIALIFFFTLYIIRLKGSLESAHSGTPEAKLKVLPLQAGLAAPVSVCPSDHFGLLAIFIFQAE